MFDSKVLKNEDGERMVFKKDGDRKGSGGNNGVELEKVDQINLDNNGGVVKSSGESDSEEEIFEFGEIDDDQPNVGEKMKSSARGK